MKPNIAQSTDRFSTKSLVLIKSRSDCLFFESSIFVIRSTFDTKLSLIYSFEIIDLKIMVRIMRNITESIIHESRWKYGDCRKNEGDSDTEYNLWIEGKSAKLNAPAHSIQTVIL